MSTVPTIPELIAGARQGDTAAFDALYAQVYDTLRQLAHRLRRERAATLSTTALVHETYLHLLPSRDLDWQSRTHFLRVAARAMRQVLVREARRRQALKRGGGHCTVTFCEALHGTSIPIEEMLTLERALQQLEALHARQARVVECRLLAGMSIEETAEALGISSATVKRDWRIARAFLVRQLTR